MFDLAPDTDTPYRKLTGDHVSTFEANGIKFLKVEPEALRLLSAAAMVGA
jgi:fumarate hydratase class I